MTFDEILEKTIVLLMEAHRVVGGTLFHLGE
jgi:hypothetical protein